MKDTKFLRISPSKKFGGPTASASVESLGKKMENLRTHSKPTASESAF